MEPEDLFGADTKERSDIVVVVVAGHDGDDVLLDPVDSLGSHNRLLLVTGGVRGQHGVPGPGGGAREGDCLCSLSVLIISQIEMFS